MAQNEWEATTRLIEAASGILAEQWPMTIRQLFYRLVGLMIENTTKAYKRLSRIMTKARNDYRIKFPLIADRSLPEYSPFVFEDTAGYAELVKRGYRKDYWHLQPNYCELWTEKDAIIGSIQDLTDELGITVRVTRGYLSTTKAHETAMHFLRIKKPITVFVLGDHDASGRDIPRDMAERIRRYGAQFTIKRLAIFAADIAKFNLPPLRVKLDDTRARGFLKKYSNKCVELDALPPNELRRRIREAVTRLIDQELWQRAVAVEKVELQSILRTVEIWPS